MNLVTSLVELEKATLDGQGFIGVLVVEADANLLRQELFDYTKKLWSHVATLFQEHMAIPIDKFKAWFEAVREDTIRAENAMLKATIARLDMQVEVAQKESIMQRTSLSLKALATSIEDDK